MGRLIHCEREATGGAVDHQRAVLIRHRDWGANHRQGLAVNVSIVGQHVARHRRLALGETGAVVYRNWRMVIINDGNSRRVIDQGCPDRIAQNNRESFIGLNQRVAHDVFGHGKSHRTSGDGDRCLGSTVVKVSRVTGGTGHDGVGDRYVCWGNLV